MTDLLEKEGTKAVARGGLANMIGSALAGGTGFAVTWIVARSLGPDQAGAFFASTAAFVLAGGLAKLGTQTGLVYWPARLRASAAAAETSVVSAEGCGAAEGVVVARVVCVDGCWGAAPAPPNRRASAASSVGSITI